MIPQVNLSKKLPYKRMVQEGQRLIDAFKDYGACRIKTEFFDDSLRRDFLEISEEYFKKCGQFHKFYGKFPNEEGTDTDFKLQLYILRKSFSKKKQLLFRFLFCYFFLVFRIYLNLFYPPLTNHFIIEFPYIPAKKSQKYSEAQA